MFKGFSDYLTHEKRYSEHTLSAYRSDLNQFKDFLEDSFELEQPKNAQYEMVRSWVVTLYNNGVRASSIKRKISSLKSYYKYLMMLGEIEENPAINIQSPRMPERLPVFIEESGIEDLFDRQFYADNYEGSRDYCIMETFYATGMRSSELSGLKINDVDFENRVIRVMGKRSKERFIPIGDHLTTVLREYLVFRHEMNLEDEGFLFVTGRGKKIYSKLVYKLVNTYLSNVTTISQKSPHVLRHTFATHMLNNGADINSVKELLGHSSLAATQIYTHNTIDKMKSVYKQAHPRA